MGEENEGISVFHLDTSSGAMAHVQAVRGLRNPSFLDKAPPAIVDKTRRRLVELEERRAALSGGPA